MGSKARRKQRARSLPARAAQSAVPARPTVPGRDAAPAQLVAPARVAAPARVTAAVPHTPDPAPTSPGGCRGDLEREAAGQVLTATCWLDPGDSGPAGPVTVRFSGRRAGITGTPSGPGSVIGGAPRTAPPSEIVETPVKLAEIVASCARALKSAFVALEKNGPIMDHCIEINRLENEADLIGRDRLRRVIGGLLSERRVHHLRGQAVNRGFGQRISGRVHRVLVVATIEISQRFAQVAGNFRRRLIAVVRVFFETLEDDAIQHRRDASAIL